MAKKAAKQAPQMVQTVDRSRPKPPAVSSDHLWYSAVHDVLLDIRDELRAIRTALEAKQ